MHNWSGPVFGVWKQTEMEEVDPSPTPNQSPNPDPDDTTSGAPNQSPAGSMAQDGGGEREGPGIQSMYDRRRKGRRTKGKEAQGWTIAGALIAYLRWQRRDEQDEGCGGTPGGHHGDRGSGDSGDGGGQAGGGGSGEGRSSGGPTAGGEDMEVAESVEAVGLTGGNGNDGKRPEGGRGNGSGGRSGGGGEVGVAEADREREAGGGGEEDDQNNGVAANPMQKELPTTSTTSHNATTTTDQDARTQGKMARRPKDVVQRTLHRMEGAAHSQVMGAAEKQQGPQVPRAAHSNREGDAGGGGGARGGGMRREHHGSEPRHGAPQQRAPSPHTPIDARGAGSSSQPDVHSQVPTVPQASRPKRARPAPGYYDQNPSKKKASKPRKARTPKGKAVVHMERAGTPGGPLKFLVKVGPALINRITARRTRPIRDVQSTVYDDMG